LIKELIEEIELDPRTADSVIPASSTTKKRRRIEDGEGVDVEVVESAFASGKEKTVSATSKPPLRSFFTFLVPKRRGNEKKSDRSSFFEL
jgi:hypothetical protein